MPDLPEKSVHTLKGELISQPRLQDIGMANELA